MFSGDNPKPIVRTTGPLSTVIAPVVVSNVESAVMTRSPLAPSRSPVVAPFDGTGVCVEGRLADDTCIVLDAGTGIRTLGKQLAAEHYERPIHLFITHGHWDHIIGLPFFGPMYASNATIVLHSPTERSARAMRS